MSTKLRLGAKGLNLQLPVSGLGRWFRDMECLGADVDL